MLDISRNKTTMNTVRVQLEYERKVTQIERGVVTVEVPVIATVGDAYREAYDKNFTSYLPKSYEVLNEDWDFVMKRETESVS